MSESDDDPPKAEGGDKPKSLFDSNWDALLGPPPSSPTFAPPPVARREPASAQPIEPVPAAKREELEEPEEPEARHEAGPKPDATPRTSDASASVSGEFKAPEPRPEPSTPPRYERPAGVSPDYDSLAAAERDYPYIPFDVPGPITEEDDEPEPSGRERDGGKEDGATVIPLASRAAAKSEAGDEPDDDDDDDDDDHDDHEQPGGRDREPPRPSNESDAEGPGGGVTRNALILLAVAAAIVIIGVYVNRSRTREADERQSRTSEADEGPGERQSQGGEVGPDEDPEAPSSSTRSTTGGPAPTPERRGDETGELGETGEADETGDTGGSETAAIPEPAPSAESPKSDDPRDPSHVPPDTPEANAKAFFKLPVSIHDGPPLGGIGRSGVHVDQISMARGRENTDCDDPTRNFSAGEADYVNVCIRVVHPREQETLRVIWEKDGKVTRRGRVRIPDLHAYTTRAYLLIRPEYVGSWRVRIVPEGEEDTTLAVAKFEISE